MDGVHGGKRNRRKIAGGKIERRDRTEGKETRER